MERVGDCCDTHSAFGVQSEKRAPTRTVSRATLRTSAVRACACARSHDQVRVRGHVPVNLPTRGTGPRRSAETSCCDIRDAPSLGFACQHACLRSFSILFGVSILVPPLPSNLDSLARLASTRLVTDRQSNIRQLRRQPAGHRERASECHGGCRCQR